ncbi:MAG: choice-of-anchor R domain-containing protein [Planctomycetota bacterium]
MAAAVMLASGAAAANGQVIFSNLDANDSSGNFIGYSITGSNNPSVADEFSFAFAFDVAGGNFQLDSLELVAFAANAGPGGPDQTGTMEVTLFADNGGVPGAPLETISAFVDIFNPTPDDFFLPLITFESSTNPDLLDGQTYWVGASSATDTAFFSWAGTSPPAPGQAARMVNGAPWEAIAPFPNNGVAAFRVNAIPAPGAGLLVAAGGVLATRRRR